MLHRHPASCGLALVKLSLSPTRSPASGWPCHFRPGTRHIRLRSAKLGRRLAESCWKLWPNQAPEARHRPPRRRSASDVCHSGRKASRFFCPSPSARPRRHAWGRLPRDTTPPNCMTPQRCPSFWRLDTRGSTRGGCGLSTHQLPKLTARAHSAASAVSVAARPHPCCAHDARPAPQPPAHRPAHPPLRPAPECSSSQADRPDDEDSTNGVLGAPEQSAGCRVAASDAHMAMARYDPPCTMAAKHPPPPTSWAATPRWSGGPATPPAKMAQTQPPCGWSYNGAPWSCPRCTCMCSAGLMPKLMSKQREPINKFHTPTRKSKQKKHCVMARDPTKT